MKASELMVTDLVFHDGKVIRVDAVHKRKIGYHKTTDKLTWLFSGQFEPIPLTPEILEKNWFENQGFRHHIEYMGKNDRVVLSNEYSKIYSDNKWVAYVKNEDYKTIGICELTYVHQLQQLLKLCKIDKEIVV